MYFEDSYWTVINNNLKIISAVTDLVNYLNAAS